MQITVATLDDIDDLCRLLDVLFTQEVEFTPDHVAQRRGLAMVIENPAVGQILIALQQGVAVGMVNLLFTVSTALGKCVALLEDMVVMPDARNSGAGSALMQQAIEIAKSAGCGRITVLSDVDNTDAHRFYQRHHFTQSAMLPLRLMLD